MLDDDTLEYFRKTAEAAEMDYQTMINATLRESVAKEIGTRIRALDRGKTPEKFTGRTARRTEVGRHAGELPVSYPYLFDRL